MRSRWATVAAAALGAVLLTNVSAASSDAPYLRSAAASRGHVVAVFTLPSRGDTGDMMPGDIAIAVRSSVQANGSFVPANVRVQESLANVTAVSGGLRFRTAHKLRPGRYYVKVSGRAMGLDCTPKTPCKSLWSNARRVVIPHP